MLVHRYECIECDIHLFGSTADELAIALNNHNRAFHPADSCLWKGAGVIYSSRYAGPERLNTQEQLAVKTRPEYTTSYGTNLTAEDRKFLADLAVKW